MEEIIKQESQPLTTAENNAIEKALSEQWLDEKFIAQMLEHIAKSAVTHDNKWNPYEDFPTKLRAIQTLIKIKDKKFDRGWINLNFFQAPDINNLKY